MKKILLLILTLPLLFCDMENRYPDSGEFCTPMQEIPNCIQMNFREKTLTLNNETYKVKMVNRAQYEKELKEEKLEIDLLSEHRIRIRYKNRLSLELMKEEIYIRIKGPRISIWKRIQNWKEK